ncbi:nuclear fragile X mental retardation protein interacting protein 1 [Gamsiella multidivaricata]|nr:nuclear fragile X mental retardation protein interacting protein 1 [Gamsiella multidivaricata]
MLHPLTPVLNTPEDIAAWIAQRRKAWPTEANIQKREQERQEMIAKGQIVDEHSTKGFNNRDKRGRNNNNNNHNNKRDQRPAAIQEAYGVPTKKPKTEGAAGDGMVAYASSNEHSEEDEDVNDIMDPIKDAVTSKDPSVIGKVLLPRDKSTRPKTPCKYFLRGNCTRGDKCTFSHDPSLTNKIKKPNPVSNMKRVFRTRPSLLQMLLSGEIKEEKNRLLEAMRYIVESNFFEKQEPSGTLVEEVA